MAKMNKTLLAVSLIILCNICAFSQSKSIADAKVEIQTFSNFGNFSITHDDRKDLTSAKVSINLREDNKSLSKTFKKFSLEITAIYSGIAIDNKPFRNTLCIRTQSKGFKFANNNSLTVMLENEEVNFGNANRSTKAKGRESKRKSMLGYYSRTCF